MPLVPDRPAHVEHDENGVPEYRRGKKRPAWLMLAAPFLLLTGWVAKRAKGICWPAAILVPVLFTCCMIPLERNSILRMHWIWNTNKIIGIKIWGIPLEEILCYHLFAPFMAVLIFQFILNKVKDADTKSD